MGNEILMRIWTWVHMQPALFDSFLRKGLKLFQPFFMNAAQVFSNAICGNITSFINEFKANGRHKSHSNFPDCIYQKREVQEKLLMQTGIVATKQDGEVVARLQFPTRHDYTVIQ